MSAISVLSAINPKRLLRDHRWFFAGVALPYLITRAALLIIGWFSHYYIASTCRRAATAQLDGRWEWSPERLLDIWGRLDTGWYFSIIKHGYRLAGEAGVVQSNVVFFPLYPGLVKLALLILPVDPSQNDQILLVGVIISNLLLLGALALLYKIALRVFADDRAAEMSVWYVLLAPAGFIFSTFYTESAFLFFSLAAFLAALHRRWALACVFGMILSTARPLGVMIGVPILILYLEAIRWRLRDIRPSILWLGIIPLGILGFFTYMHFQVGDFWAPIRVQASWQHEVLPPWQAFFDPTVCYSEKIRADRAVCLAALLLSIASVFMLRSRSYGIHALILILVPLSGGTLDGASRYSIVAFPVFLQLVLLARSRPWLDHTTRVVMFTLQVLFFMGWCQWYRIV